MSNILRGVKYIAGKMAAKSGALKTFLDTPVIKTKVAKFAKLWSRGYVGKAGEFGRLKGVARSIRKYGTRGAILGTGVGAGVGVYKYSKKRKKNNEI